MKKQLMTADIPAPLTPAEVRGWRIAAGLTLGDFARLLGVSSATISRLEAGQVRPDPALTLARDGWAMLHQEQAEQVFGVEDIRKGRHRPTLKTFSSVD